PLRRDDYHTRIIETGNSSSGLSIYPKQHLYTFLTFPTQPYISIINTPQYPSLLFFKNHPPISRPSLPHPHIQIIA
ncbi:DUF4931 domain-containing protein, partial [Priestia megaterium]|uniref:DUF4931 domain-containing protein n=1 Tax=Priestia megaterium TaxID=1404 RepID=UPI0012B79195